MNDRTGSKSFAAGRPLAPHVQAAIGQVLQRRPAAAPAGGGSPASPSPAPAPHVQAAVVQARQLAAPRAVPRPPLAPRPPAPLLSATLQARPAQPPRVIQAHGRLYLFTSTSSLAALPIHRRPSPAIRQDPAAVVQRMEEKSKEKISKGSSSPGYPLYGFNRDKDKPYPRKSDVDLNKDDWITSDQRGLSVSSDLTVSSSFLEGHLWLLPAGTDLSDLGVVADGKDVGGNHYWGHHTIYPAKKMKYGGNGQFKSKVKALPWKYLGPCYLKNNENQKAIAKKIMELGEDVGEIGKLLK